MSALSRHEMPTQIESFPTATASADSLGNRAVAAGGNGGAFLFLGDRFEHTSGWIPTRDEPEIEYDEYEEEKGRSGTGTRTATTSKQALENRLERLLFAQRAATKPHSPIPATAKKKKKKKNKGKSKKMAKSSGATSKSEKDRAAAESEENRNRLIKELQEEIQQEALLTEKQEASEERESSLRKVQLEATWYALFERKKAYMDYLLESQEQENWRRYMTCDGLPDPGILSQLNSFIYFWSLEDDGDAAMRDVVDKCKVVIHLLEQLDDIIGHSIMALPGYIEECKKMRQEFREKLHYWIDMASYRLLRRIEQEMIREDLRTARFVKESNELICCIWALIKLPIGLKQLSEKDRKAVEVTFDEIHLSIKMPLDVDCYCMAIRGLWLVYDHYSDLGRSYLIPQLPEELRASTDLLSYCHDEYEEKRKLRLEQVDERKLRLDQRKAMVERLLNPPVNQQQQIRTKKDKAKLRKVEPEPEPEPLPYLPTPDELIRAKEEEARKEIRRLLFTRCEKTEVNLRKYRILGGVYHLDLVFQPPQPKDMRGDVFLTTLQVPKELKYVPFLKPYKAPPPVPESERSPEVIEAEMKALEAAMEALALVTLTLPENVLWFEPPLVAHWIPERRIWSTQDVHDIKYNEEKQIITFRTGRLGIHGLAAFKFINLPFQSWELKPESSSSSSGGAPLGVVLNVTAAIVQAEFVVREDLVCLQTLVGGNGIALKDIMGKFMKLHSLIQKMRASGCDLFPERDAASYLKGLPMKHEVTQQHLHACMGLLCTAYVFTWSRWNAVRPHRQIVLQLKEIHGCVAKEKATATLLVTPMRSVLVNCTEVSPEFSETPLDGDDAKFHADLYHLALHTCGIKSRLLIHNLSAKLAMTAAQLLERTNVIGMSS